MGNDQSTADALFSATQKRVLGALFGQPGRSFYATELIALCGGGSGAVQRELARLVESQLVTTRRVGTQKHYQANPDAALYPELCSIAAKVLAPNPPENAASHVAAIAAAKPPAPAQQNAAPATPEPPPAAAPEPRPEPTSSAEIGVVCARYNIRKLSLIGAAAIRGLGASTELELLAEFEPPEAASGIDTAQLKRDFSALFGGPRIIIASAAILDDPHRRDAITAAIKVLYEAANA